MRASPYRPSPATIIASLALFFSLAGTGLAASRYLITSVSQIKPSVRHALRGERGRRGIAGPRGLQGLTGAPGVPGRDAAIAFSNVDSVNNGAPLTAGQETSVTATCPTGEDVLNGGYSSSDAVVSASFATDPRSWTVQATLGSGPAPGNGGWITAEAECVSTR